MIRSTRESEESDAITRSYSRPLTGSTDNSVSIAIEAYTSWLSQSGKSEGTVSMAKRFLNAIVFDVMGCDEIDQLDADITLQFIEHQENHGYAGKTIRSQLAELKRFSKWLVKSGRFNTDPIANLKFDIDENESVDRAQVRFVRLFKMIELVSNSRFGVTLEMLREACCEVSSVCIRTIRRDIDLLVAIGAIRKDREASVDLILYKSNPISRISQLFIK